MTVAPRVRLPTVSRREALVWTLVCNVELTATLAYFAFTDARLTSPAFALYGLAWVNVGLFALARYDPPDAGRTARRRAAAVAVGYAALLAVFGGIVGLAGPTTPTGVGLALLPPGWGPALTYGGATIAVVAMPAKVIGYAALAYLLYGAVLDATAAGAAGALGLFSCVSCSFPLLTGAAAALFGGGAFVATAVAGLGYGPSTAVFLLTVALLWLRPGLGWLG